MKKIIILLFLFLLPILCYLIYSVTETKEKYILAIGDEIANVVELSSNENIKYNNDFINEDYRISDISNILKYNKEITKDNKTISIHMLLKKADIVIISIGMNDIYYKLNDDTKDIYTYINNMLETYEEVLDEISKYDYQNVYILGYYNIANKNNDLFVYTNYKLKNIVKKYRYKYIELNNFLNNNQKYYQKNNNFGLNKAGYEQILKLIVEK